MKVLIDSNVIFDVILKREKFYKPALQIFHLAELKKIKAFISSSSVTDIYYMLHKQFHDKQIALQYIKELLSIFYVAKTDSKVIQNATKLNWTDFEDCVQFCVAKRNFLKCIITRNTKDFVLSDIPVYEPVEFLNCIE